MIIQNSILHKSTTLISIFTLFVNILFSYVVVKDFSMENLLLFFILFFIQLIFRDFRAIFCVLLMYIVWMFCYYIYVYELGIYYTPEQTFTDSNYYDYYALQFCDYPIKEIYQKAEITWQSSFVITFYSIVYKVFGKSLLNPVIINLILLHITFYNLKIRRIKNTQHLIILFLFLPFMGLNLVVPGKDVIMILLISIYFSSILNSKIGSKGILIKAMVIIIGFFNRANTLPIFLMFEVVNYNKWNKKIKYMFLLLSSLMILVLPQYIESIMGALGFENLIEKQQSNFAYSDGLANLLLPSNPLLFVLATPIRTLAYLISPFPFITNVIDGFYDRNFFTFWFILFKFLSGFVWAIVLVKFCYSKFFKYNPIVNAIVLLSIFTSTVYLVQGGRYRVMCDLLLIVYFSYNSIFGKYNWKRN